MQRLTTTRIFTAVLILVICGSYLVAQPTEQNVIREEREFAKESALFERISRAKNKDHKSTENLIFSYRTNRLSYGSISPSHLQQILKKWQPTTGTKFTAIVNPVASYNSGVTLASLEISVPGLDRSDEAKKLLLRAIKHLQTMLNRPIRPRIEQHRRAIAQAEHVFQSTKKLQEEALSVQQRLLAEANELEIPIDSFQELQNQFIKDRFTLRTELVGMKARYQALLIQVDKEQVKIKAHDQKERKALDPLMKILELRHQMSKMMRTNNQRVKGTVSLNDILQAELEIQQATANLARAELELSQNRGNIYLDQLNERLVETQISLQETEAQYREVEKTLKIIQSSKARELVTQFRHWESQEIRYSRELRETEISLKALKKRQPVLPKITIIDETTDEEKPTEKKKKAKQQN